MVSKWFRGKKAGRLFLAPTVVTLLTLTLFPFIFCLILTFGRVSLAPFEISFAGFRNWARLFDDYRFWTAINNTLFIVGLAVCVEYLIGLVLAVVLNQNIKGAGVLRNLFTIPMILAPIAIGYIWWMIYGYDYGPFNHLLVKLGIGRIGWLTDRDVAIFSIILSDIWQWTPLMLLILFAGLQGVPLELEEAALIDGASQWQVFWYVTFPMLAPASIAAIVLRTIEAFQIIAKPFVMTGGGPGTSTETLTLLAYKIGLKGFDLPYGATIAFSLFLLVLAFSMFFILGTRRFITRLV